MNAEDGQALCRDSFSCPTDPHPHDCTCSTRPQGRVDALKWGVGRDPAPDRRMVPLERSSLNPPYLMSIMSEEPWWRTHDLNTSISRELKLVTTSKIVNWYPPIID